MNRRRLLQGVVAGAAGLLLPPSVGEVAAEVERRWWSLGAVPGREPRIVDVWEQDFIQSERYDANAAWDTVYTGIVIRVDRTPQPYLGLQYLKVPRQPNIVTVSAHWVK